MMSFLKKANKQQQKNLLQLLFLFQATQAVKNNHKIKSAVILDLNTDIQNGTTHKFIL